ncbi:hypothetical protein [Sinorhizobium fredii]|uniref:hypothetical protein n=1 Tax=Rhizobium fredii TaxID=380 RepID=UPI0004B446D2|nr:hypothetical protein [Sinorhizobium fredii]
MKNTRNVSRPVSPDVSPDDAEIISAKKRNRKLKKRSSGRYLVRSCGIYLFQIRLPKQIGGATARPVRVSLGALAHQDAREIADALAVLARQVFREIEKRMAGNQASRIADLLGIDPDDMVADDDWPYELTSLVLKGGLYDLREPAREPTPEEARGLALMKGLVRIGKEVRARQEDRPHDDMIADNAEMLAASHIAKYDRAAESVKLTERLYTSVELPQVAPPEVAPPATQKVQASAARLITSSATPAFKLDRRMVERPPSTKPRFSEIASKYLALRKSSKSGENKDIAIAETRLNLFAELIGDHPVDTYTATDLQAFIDLMKYWPAKQKPRAEHLSAREIIASNQGYQFETLARKTLEEGYMAVVKAAINSGMVEYEYKSPFAGARLAYPDTARAKIPTEPLGYHKTQKLFETGVQSGLLDNAMLPLLGFLTGRRLGLLIHLQGRDFREKYKGVWVAQTTGIVQDGGVWKRVPIKTGASVSFFVLHNFLTDIGFVQWAQAQGDQFLFRGLINLADPSKSASSYMARLFNKAGIKEARGEVFHSLRGGYISESSDQNVEKRDRKLQVGHELGDDEHDLYGFRSLTEKRAREIANLKLNPEIDFSMFRGLDFDKLAAAKRTFGRRPAAQ